MATHTYRWTDEDERLIAAIAEDGQVTKTDAIRRAIRAYAAAQRNDAAAQRNDSRVAHLEAQVEWQRRLIEQQVGLIAQANALAARALPEADETRRGWRWPWQR